MVLQRPLNAPASSVHRGVFLAPAHGASSALRRSATQLLSERQGSSWVSGPSYGVCQRRSLHP